MSRRGTMRQERHAEHERLAREVRSWYRRSYPEMGYQVEERELGFYRRTLRQGEVIVTAAAPEKAVEMVEDARRYFGQGRVRLYVEDRSADQALGPALDSAGCRKGPAITFLAHVGPPQQARPVMGLTVEEATPRTVRTYLVTAQKAFGNSEEEPDPADLEPRERQRLAEMKGEGRFFVARMAGEPAAVIGWYEGEDRFVFQLATRLPFRGRGIAQRLLLDAVADAYRRGCRSAIINANEEDWPVRLYRRLGFRDEVYWRREYELSESQ